MFYRLHLAPCSDVDFGAIMNQQVTYVMKEVWKGMRKQTLRLKEREPVWLRVEPLGFGDLEAYQISGSLPWLRRKMMTYFALSLRKCEMLLLTN